MNDIEAIRKRLRECIENSEYSYDQLSKLTGITKSSLQRYATGATKKIPMDAISAVEKALNIPMGYIMGWNQVSNIPSSDLTKFPNLRPLPKTRKVPRLGKIACGTPIGAIENIEGYDDVDEDVDCDYTLICEGDSMVNARILDGDTVYIKQQSIVENGEIAAVSIEGETTLKRFYRNGNEVMLVAENPAYPPMRFTLNEADDIIILGKAVAFKSWIK